MTDLGRQGADRSDVATPVVGADDPRPAETVDQAGHEALGGLCVAVLPGEEVEYTPVGTDGAPRPVRFAAHREEELARAPLVRRLRSVALDTGGEGVAEAIAPEPDGLAAGDHTAVGEHIPDIGGAQGEAVVGRTA